VGRGAAVEDQHLGLHGSERVVDHLRIDHVVLQGGYGQRRSHLGQTPAIARQHRHPGAFGHQRLDHAQAQAPAATYHQHTAFLHRIHGLHFR
jgi:hypothetical protein